MRGMYFALGAAIGLSSGSAWARPWLTVSCEEPLGSRFDYLRGSVKTNSDGFTGANPRFIFDDDKAGKVLVLWGHARRKDAPSLPEDTIETLIVKSSENLISLVGVDAGGGDATMMYTLYPKEGLVYFTQHKYILFSIPVSSSYNAKCVFSKCGP